MTITSEQSSLLRSQFFDYLFGDETRGYLCIATADRARQNFRQRFFVWPDQRDDLSAYLDQAAPNRNVWFCVSLLSSEERKKEFALPIGYAWAEWDQEVPETVQPKPTILVESSPGKYHGYWRIEGPAIPADVAEDFSRRIAYQFDADKSGWDSVQLLRVPFTQNLKYNPSASVKIIDISADLVTIDQLDAIPATTTTNGDGPQTIDPVPDVDSLPSSDAILYKYKSEGKVDENFIRLYAETPHENADWSKILWRFVKTCLEVGMTKEETFAVALHAACNKYERDNRPISYLWRDVVKAEAENARFVSLIGGSFEVLKMPELVDPDEVEEDAFIKEYKDWARVATDAPEQYHELSVFIALSAIICSGLYLRVEWGEIVPNLWGLMLGESTLTRKTTAMRLATDMLNDIDDSLVVATDGTAEGLLSGLSNRPQRVSIFYKDEVSGFFDSINRKDYLAGLPETLTQLYDVPKVLARRLRKETITITEPYFIFFGGGIRDKVYSLLNEEYFLSGFLPRFLVVSGENDLARIRRTGPPSQSSTERKDRILQTFADLRERYNTTATVSILGQEVEMHSRIEAELEDDAWELFGEIEEKLTNAGAESDLHMVALPTFTRMAFSILKMSLLVAASRRSPTTANKLIVIKSDIQQAAFYVQKWGHYTIDLITNSTKGQSEKIIDRAMTLIKKKEGITKAEFMQRMHLTARDSRELIDTLVQRGMVDMKQHGRGHRLYSL